MIRALDKSDVLHCIGSARRHDLPPSVRGGGHNVAGNAVRDGGVMLDLSGAFSEIRADETALAGGTVAGVGEAAVHEIDA